MQFRLVPLASFRYYPPPKTLYVDALVKEDDVDTLKTAIVVVLLLAVLYGVYVRLNRPDAEVSEEIAWAQQNTTDPLKLEFGEGAEGSEAATASLADSAPWTSDHATGSGEHLHGHDPTMIAPLATPAAELGSSQHQMPNAAPAVSAPQLITSNGDESSLEQAGVGDTHSAATYAAVGQPESSPPPAPGSSVYAPPANANAPTGAYGDIAVMSGGPQEVAPAITATAEPRVGDSYGAAAAPLSNNQVSNNQVSNNQAVASNIQPVVPPAGNSRIDSVLATARGQMDQGQYYEALLTLSFAYSAPGLSPEESWQLQEWLDPLAGKVIYSNEHLVGAAYQLQAGETLQSVATKHNVPWQLLANINGLRDPAEVQPGASIKVVPGPFHADIDVASNSMTLFAGRLYAGKFAIKVNPSKLPPAGEYQVNDKQPGHSYYAGNAQTLSPQDPQNPFGGVWIDLGNDVAIHGTSNSPGQSERWGCISLDNKDANDIYGILSRGSNVVIRR